MNNYVYTAIGLVVFGCNAGVEDDAYPAHNGEQYAPTNMGND